MPSEVEPTRAELFAASWDLLKAESLGFDINDPAVQRTVVDAHQRQAAKKAEVDNRREAAGIKAEKAAVASGRKTTAESIVYYMRVGNRIKIGYTTNLTHRLQSLLPEELLATEPGGRMLEKVRHQQFADLRCGGEWFRMEEPLTEHVDKLRAA